jgi:GTP cyclohydrolase I
MTLNATNGRADGTDQRRFSRDLQVPERLTTQVAGRPQRELEPEGVGVVLEAEHPRMSLRGVVRDDARTRQEFLAPTTRTTNDQ